MSELSDLKTFIAVAKTGSFARAARQLSLSPAMIGRRIQALEDKYGMKLIERTTRAHKVTPIGMEFLSKAILIVDSFEELDELSRPVSSLSGRIRLTVPTTFGITRIAAMLTKFTELHPAVTIEMSLNDRRIDLINEGFDLAIRIGDLPASSLVARRIGTYEFVCCASPDYFARHKMPLTPEALIDASCIINLNLAPRNIWPFTGKNGEAILAHVAGPIEIDNGEAQRIAALAGAGIIFAPKTLVFDDLANGRLVEVLADWQKTSLPIHAVHPSRNFVPKRVSAFIEFVAHNMRQTP